MLLVDNLSLSVADHDLRLLFSPFGHVVLAQVTRTRMGVSLRFGYVEMEQADEANYARRALDGATFHSFALRISNAGHDGLDILPTGLPEILHQLDVHSP